VEWLARYGWMFLLGGLSVRNFAIADYKDRKWRKGT